jgi:predicted permease
MIFFLRVFFIIVLISMLAVTTWASKQVPLWKIPYDTWTHPWWIATLFDAYWGFLTFYCWVVYKETSVLARAVWLVAILLLGNIAMAVYALIQLFRVPANGSIETVLLRRKRA